MVETVEFTPVYDDATARSLSSEFARLEGEMLGEGEEKGTDPERDLFFIAAMDCTNFLSRSFVKLQIHI